MSMKAFFAALFLLLAACWLGALLSLDRPKDGAVHLVWATDPNPARKRQSDVFTRLNPGIVVEVVSNANEKLMVQCATGTGPDIVDHVEIQSIGQYVDAGILKDLTDLAKGRGFAPEDTYPAIRPGLMVEGRQYRYPCNVWANAIIYNKAIFDDLGLPYPKKDWTYAEFIATAQRINAGHPRSGRKYTAVSNWNNQWTLLDLLVGHDAHFFSPDGLTCRLDSPQALAAMRLYHDLMYVDKVLPTAAEAASMSTQGGFGVGGLTWFSEGKAAMFSCGRWYLVLSPSFPALKGHLGASLLPRVAGQPSRGMVDARGSGINSKTRHPAEALKFMQYLGSPDYSRLIAEDGDALPPRPDVARQGRDLVNPAEADPAFHQVFIDAVRNARVLDISPFADLNLVIRWLQEECIEKIEGDASASPEAVMRRLADEVNQEIRRNLERSGFLRAKYEKITGKPWTPDWWRSR
jgi:multiple sugar transport system substrate-binding protein